MLVALNPGIVFPEQWEFFVTRKKMDEMDLSEFLSHWQVSREELAIICECSLNTVNHWFMKTERSYRPPELHHRRRLAEAHREMTRMSQEPLVPQRLREIYNRYRK